MRILCLDEGGMASNIMADALRCFFPEIVILNYDVDELDDECMREKPDVVVVTQERCWPFSAIRRIWLQLREFFPSQPIIWISERRPNKYTERCFSSLKPTNFHHVALRYGSKPFQEVATIIEQHIVGTIY